MRLVHQLHRLLVHGHHRNLRIDGRLRAPHPAHLDARHDLEFAASGITQYRIFFAVKLFF
ncbi:MAG: hypothetical protein U0798_04715 [Gemmataceae bacterium]